MGKVLVPEDPAHFSYLGHSNVIGFFKFLEGERILSHLVERLGFYTQLLLFSKSFLSKTICSLSRLVGGNVILTNLPPQPYFWRFHFCLAQRTTAGG